MSTTPKPKNRREVHGSLPGEYTYTTLHKNPKDSTSEEFCELSKLVTIHLRQWHGFSTFMALLDTLRRQLRRLFMKESQSPNFGTSSRELPNCNGSERTLPANNLHSHEPKRAESSKSMGRLELESRALSLSGYRELVGMRIRWPLGFIVRRRLGKPGQSGEMGRKVAREL